MIHFSCGNKLTFRFQWASWAAEFGGFKSGFRLNLLKVHSRITVTSDPVSTLRFTTDPHMSRDCLHAGSSLSSHVTSPRKKESCSVACMVTFGMAAGGRFLCCLIFSPGDCKVSVTASTLRPHCWTMAPVRPHLEQVEPVSFRLCAPVPPLCRRTRGRFPPWFTLPS